MKLKEVAVSILENLRVTSMDIGNTFPVILISFLSQPTFILNGRSICLSLIPNGRLKENHCSKRK